MKTIKYSLIALAVLMLCSCSKKDYLKVIPANSAMVASVNVRSLMEKGDFANSSLMDMISDRMDDLDDDDRFGKYMDDPMATGIDLAEPIYTFITRDNLYGIVMGVRDKDKLEEFFTDLRKADIVSRPTEKKGVMCGKMENMGYAFTDDALLFYMNLDFKDVSSSTITKMMTGKHDSFTDTDSYKKVSDADGEDAMLYLNLYNLPKEAKEVYAQYEEGVSLKPTDVELLASLTFDKGVATLKAKAWGRTEKAQKFLDEQAEDLHTLEGVFADRTPDDLLLWAAANVSGDKVWKELKKNETLQQQIGYLTNDIDVEPLIRAVSGDMALALSAGDLKNYNSVSSNYWEDWNDYYYYYYDDFDNYDDFYYAKHGTGRRNIPEFSLWTQVKSTSFMKKADEWQSAIASEYTEMTQDGDHSYVLKNKGDEVKFGTKDNDFFIATPHAYNAYRGGSALDEYKDDIKKSYAFMFLDLHSLLRMDDNLLRQLAGMNINLEDLKSAVVKVTAPNEMTLQIFMEDDDENFLKQLFE